MTGGLDDKNDEDDAETGSSELFEQQSDNSWHFGGNA
jgi:hypothetical protein